MHSPSRILALMLTLGAASLSAQAPGVVRGMVLNAKDSTPIQTALVIVRLTTDTSRVTRAQTAVTGAFTMSNLRTGTYRMRITALGFAPDTQTISITESAPVVNVGSIRLSRFAVALKGVDVTEEAAAVAIEPDRNSYKAKDVAPGAANASEILEQTPAVSVDADGKVALRGNENVVVQVNGRATPMTGVQLGAYLKSLPASAVDRIEVIPNPSAKYDPEGTAGIINVALKTTVDLGWSGGSTFNVHSFDRYFTAGNLGYQRGALSTALSASVNNDIRDTPGLNDLSTPVFFSNQDIQERNGNGGQTLNANVDYKLNARDVLSNALTLNHRMASDETNTAYEESTGRFDRMLRSNVSGVLFDEDVALKRTFVPRKHELSGELRFNRSRESDATSLWRQTASSSLHTDGEQDNIVAIGKQATAQVDYVRTLGDRTKIETGYKGNIRWLDRDYDVLQDSLGTGTWSPSSKSNALSFSETVNAAYVVVSQGAGKVELQAGLRAEQASRDFTLATSAQDFPFRYGSLFPSGVVRYSMTDLTQLKASYSRRIRRPGSNELNPFPAFYDLQNVFVGNPQLNPELTDALEFGLVRTGAFGTLQLSPFFRHTTNVIRTVIKTGDHVEGRDVTTFTYSNVATSRAWGTDVNASLPAGKRVTGFASLNIYKTSVDGTPSASLSPTGVTWTGRLNGTTQLTPDLLLNVAYVYRAAIPVVDGHFYSAQNTNITIRRKLDGDHSSIGLTIVDPLATNTFHIAVAGPVVDQETQRTLGLRGVFVRYQYNFGQTPRVREVQAEPQSSSAIPG